MPTPSWIRFQVEAQLSEIIFSGRSYKLDEWGFLDPPDQWDRDFANGMAIVQGIRGGLGPAHWSFLEYLRRKFHEENTIPLLVVACMENRLHLSDLRRLFPTGYHRGACRIAGINYDFISSVNLWHTYETAPPAKAPYDIDQVGFLKDHRQWDPGFVDFIQQMGGSSYHPGKEGMKILLYLRRRYRDTGTVPTVFETCTANGLGLEELGKLFPGGYRRGACRLAGLPFLG